MSLPFQVDSLDSVPETLRSHYTEQGGTFQLQIDGLPPEPSKLVEALRKERETNKAIKKLRKSPEEISTLLAEREAAPAQLDAILDQHSRAWAGKIAALEAELRQSHAYEHDVLVNAALVAALERGRATPVAIDILPEMLAPRIVIKREADKRAVLILAADGTPMAGTGEGGAATFHDLVGEAREKYPSVFYGSGASGSGTTQKGQRPASPKTLSRSAFEDLGPAERAAKIKAGFTIHD
jgi:hypothetical protein